MVTQRIDKPATEGPAGHGATRIDRAESATRTGGSSPMFEKPDWAAFRTMAGLCRRAGTTQHKLAEVVIKELVDNALDSAGDCELTISEGVVVVQDRGQGIEGDDEEIARLFSIGRPLTSSKYFRLPTRGALGNGLRVVVGAVVATGGKLFVSTKGCRLEIVADPSTGESRAIHAGPYGNQGTRIEIELGKPLELTPADMNLGEIAIVAARAQRKKYKGKTSPGWYDTDSFHDLMMSIQPEATTVREFITNFDGCSAKAPEIAGEFSGRVRRV